MQPEKEASKSSCLPSRERVQQEEVSKKVKTLLTAEELSRKTPFKKGGHGPLNVCETIQLG